MPTAPRRRPLTRRACLAAAVTSLAAGCRTPDPAPTPASTPAPTPASTAGTTRGARREARFELVSPASAVRVRAADLAADLCRVVTPAGSGLTPAVAATGGLVRAALRPTGAAGPDTVDVTLHAGVRWALAVRAGAGELHLDLAAAALAWVAVTGGAGLLRLFLPRPARPVVVRLAGGLGRCELYPPPGVPVYVRGAARATRPGLGGPGYLVDARAAIGELVL